MKMNECFAQLPSSPFFEDAPSWLKKAQETHFAAWLKQGFPSKKDENWKYLNFTPLANTSFVLPEKASSSNLVAAQSFKGIKLVFENGFFQPNLSNVSDLPAGLTIKPLKSAVLENEDLLKPFFEKTEALNHPFINLNTACLTEGLLLHISKNAVLDEPICLIYLNSEERAMFHHRNIISLEKNVEATLIEAFVGDKETSYFSNMVTQVQLQENSKLTCYKLQEESPKAYHTACTDVDQADSSSFSTFHAGMGSQLSRDDINVKLAGNASHCDLKGFYSTQEKQCIDYHLSVEHLAEHTQSSQHYKGILKDQSKAVFNGKVFVESGASKTVAHQENRNILLSDQAEVDTKPELEIYTDDVKCSHGATVGPLEKEAIFYLQSRGMTKEQAAKLLIDAFFNELIDTISNEEVKKKLEQYVRP